MWIRLLGATGMVLYFILLLGYGRPWVPSPVVWPMPLYFLANLIVPVGIVVWFDQSRGILALLKPAQGLICPRCHYNLSGLPDIGVCPECNTRYEHTLVRELWLRTYLLKPDQIGLEAPGRGKDATDATTKMRL